MSVPIRLRGTRTILFAKLERSTNRRHRIRASALLNGRRPLHPVTKRADASTSVWALCQGKILPEVSSRPRCRRAEVSYELTRRHRHAPPFPGYGERDCSARDHGTEDLAVPARIAQSLVVGWCISPWRSWQRCDSRVGLPFSPGKIGQPDDHRRIGLASAPGPTESKPSEVKTSIISGRGEASRPTLRTTVRRRKRLSRFISMI